MGHFKPMFKWISKLDRGERAPLSQCVRIRFVIVPYWHFPAFKLNINCVRSSLSPLAGLPLLFKNGSKIFAGQTVPDV